MLDVVLVFEQPINRRFIGQGFANHLERGRAVHVEETLMIDFVGWNFQHRRIEPDRIDDA